ncbi:MAG: Ig-like domain-containing protein [Candidatus Electronema sp. VV]
MKTLLKNTLSRSASAAAVFLATLLPLSTAQADPYPPEYNNNVSGKAIDGISLHYSVAAWPAEPANLLNCGNSCGDWKPYTRFQTGANDARVQDPSNGGTAPQNYVNIASSCLDKNLPSIYYSMRKGAAADGSEDVLFFRWRVEQIAHSYDKGGNYSSTDPWKSGLWTVFFDIDGTGYRDLAAHLNGSSGGPDTAIDTVAGIYGKMPTQSISYVDDPNIFLLGHNPAAVTDAGGQLLNFQNSLTPVASWPDGAATVFYDFGTTRAIKVSANSCTEYFVDYQIPIKMLDASTHGGPKITRNTPISMLFCTSNSLNDPLQKDCALNRTWLADTNQPAPFGDYLSFNRDEPYSQPIVSEVLAEGSTDCASSTTTKLTAKVQDTLYVNSSGIVEPSIASVKFYYWHDVNGNGAADEAGGEWTYAAPGMLKAGTLNTWQANWDSSGLLKGAYLIGVQAVDDPAKVDDDVPNAPVANRTFSYLAGYTPSENSPTAKVYSNGWVWNGDLKQWEQPSGVVGWLDGQETIYDAQHGSSATPGETEDWWGNPDETGTKIATTGTELSVNVCGVEPVIVKTASVSEVFVEGEVTFTLAVTNPLKNPMNLDVTEISDTLPPGFSYKNGSTTGVFGTNNPSSSGQTLTWTGSINLIPGATATLEFVAIASSVVGNYTNTANAETSYGSIASPPVTINVGAPRLTISKTPDNFTRAPGEAITYTIRYSNDSTVDVSNVVITDVVPAGLTYTSGSCSDGCAYDSGTRTLTWNRAGLYAGEGPYTVTYSVKVDDPYSGLANSVNTVTIDSNKTDPASATASVYINAPRPMLVLEKQADKTTVDPAGVAPANQVTYTLTYQNIGTQDATGVTLTDPLPSGFTYVSATGSPSSAPAVGSNGTVTWNLGTLAAGATASVTVTAQASNPFTGTSNPAVNTATLAAANTEPVMDAANVGVVLGTSCVNNTLYFNNSDVTYNSVTYNRVTGAVAGVQASRHFPSITGNVFSNQLEEFVSDPIGPATISGTVSVTFSVNSDQNATYGLNLHVLRSDGSITSAIASTSTNVTGGSKTTWSATGIVVTTTTLNFGDRLLWRIYGTRQPSSSTVTNLYLFFDGNTPDNSSSTVCLTPGPKLSVEKNVNATTIDQLGTGRTLTYTLNYANIGGSAASGVTISDILPAGTSYNTATPAGTHVSGQEYSWNIGSLASGASGSVSITVNVDNDLTSKSSLVNNATINAIGVPPATATATTTVDTRQPDVRIFKSADKTLLTVGDTVTYTLTAVNSGTRDATAVTVTDNFPDETWFKYGSCSTTNGSCSESPSGTLSWSIGNLAAGATATATFTMTVQSGAPNGVTEKDNLATAVYGGGGTGTATSNTVTVAVSTNPNLALSKTVDKTAASSGDTLTYMLTLVNSGSGAATGVLVTDPIPAYTSYVPNSVTTSLGTAAFDSVGNRVRFDLGDVNGGAIVTMSFKVLVNSTMPAGTTDIPNTATASASNHGSRQATASSTVTAAPLLTIQKRGATSLAYPSATLTAAANGTTLFVSSTAAFEVGQYIKVGGSTARIVSLSSKSLTVDPAITASSGTNVFGSATYSLIYQNTGNADASSVVVTDTLPAGLGYFSSSPAADSYPGAGSSGDVVWNIGTVTAGASGTVQVAVFPTGTGTATNTAKIDSSETTEVSSPLNINIGGLSVTKSTSTPVLSGGGVASYIITVSNSTDAEITDVTVTDQLPPGFTYKTGSTGGTAGAGEPIGSTIPVWTITVPATGSVTITFQADIAAGTSPGTYDNEVGLIKAGVGIIPFDPTSTTVENVTVLGAGTAVLKGTIYHDQDTSDGGINPVDTPLAGVLVNVLASNGLYYTAYTDDNGFYQLVLPAGSTTVSVSTPDGYALTTGTDKNNNATLTLVSGATTVHNVGYVPTTNTGSISGTVWSDANATGTLDSGELGYPAVTVKLYAAGAIIGTDEPLAVIFSGPDGRYSFTGLSDGGYRVLVVPPASTALTNAPNPKNVTVSGGGDVTSVDFGLGANSLPVAAPDTDTAAEGGAGVSKTAAVGLIKVNDTEGDGPAAVTSAGQGANAITIGTEFATAGGGTLTLNADGSYSYTPPAQGSVPTGGLTEEFSYTITDANGDTSSSTLTITVADNNLLPVAAPDTDTAAEGGAGVSKTAAVGLIKVNDTEGDGPAAVTSAGQGANAITIGTEFATAGGGTLTLNADGSYSYTPPAQGSVPTGGLTEEFSYTITDANGDTSSSTLTITVADNNLLPVAAPDTDTAAEGGAGVSKTAAVGQIKVNDTEGDGPAAVTSAGQGANAITIGTEFATAGGGTLTLNADGSYSYTPPAQGSVPTGGLTEEFSYTITDANGDTSSSTLTITVADNNLLPVAAPDTDTAAEGGAGVSKTAAVGLIKVNDTEGDGPAAVTSAGQGANAITIGTEFATAGGGTLTLNADGSYSYTPPAQGSVPTGGLTEEFSYTITDANGDTSSSTLTITVADNNLLPVAAPDTDTAAEGGAGVSKTAAVGLIKVNDTEGDGPAAVTSAGQGANAITIGTEFATAGGGTLTLNADGSYSYTPPAQGSVPTGGLTEEFSYTITDANGDTSSSTLTITVADNNLLPVAAPDTDTAAEGGAGVSKTAAVGLIKVNDTEGDGPAAVTSAGQGANAITIGTEFATAGGGTLTLNADGSYSYTPPAQGSVPTGGLTEEFSYTITDANGDTSSSTLTITVADNNLLPVAAPDTDTAAEGGAGVSKTAAVGLIKVNDTEGDGPAAVTSAGQGANAITIGTEFATAGGGTLTLNADGSYSYTPPAQGSVPTGGLTEEFSYTITDANGDTSSSTLTITVADNNLLPVAAPDTDTAAEGGAGVSKTAAVGLIKVNDTEGDGPAAVTSAGQGANAITIGTEFATAGGGTLTLNADGSYSYTPPAQGSVPTGGLTEEFSYTITDANGDTSSSTLTITVADNNLLPVAAPDTDTAAEGGAGVSKTAAVGLIKVNDTEGDGPAAVTSAGQGANAITIGTEFATAGGGTLTLNADGSYSYTPPAQGSVPTGGLTEEFSYTITDANGDTSSSTLTITVADNNLLPVAAPDTDTAAEGGAGVSKTAAVGLIKVNDTEGDGPAAVTSAGQGANAITIGTEFATAGGGTLTLNADGSYSYTPPAQGSVPTGGLTEEFSYTITDANGDTSSSTLTITVADNNLLPVAAPDTDTAAEGGAGVSKTAAVGLIKVNDTEGDGPAAVTSAGQGANAIAIGTEFATAGGGTLTLNADGSYSYTPPAQGSVPTGGLTEEFSYTITDANGDTSSSTLTITVADNNLLPVAAPDTDTAAEGGAGVSKTAAVGLIKVNDTEGDGPAAVTSAGQGANAITIGTEFATAGGGTLTLNADGSYSYTPPAQGSVPTGGLTEEFSYTITDANGDTSSSTLTITVADNNLLPVAAPDTDTAAEGGAGVSKTAAVGLIKVNDTEGDGPAAVTSAGQGANAITIGTEFATAGGGTLTLNADGSYSYTPPAQGSVPTGGLTEEFSYTITDANGDTSSSTLTITVADNNLLPVAAPDTDTAAEGGAGVSKTAAVGLIKVNDTEGDGPAAVTSAGQGANAITIGTEFATAGGGTLTLNADGSYSYTPPAQGSVPTGGLTEEFSYTITDANGDTSSSTLTITVADNNLLPVAAPDTDTAAEGGAGVSKTAAVGLIKVNDTEGDGPAAVTSAGQGANAITIGTEFATAGGGTLTLNADGSYSYTPPAQGSVPTGGLTEEFSYTITDANGDTSSSTLTITVADNNLLPVAAPDTDTAAEGGAGVSKTAAVGLIKVNDTEGDGPAAVTSAGQGANAITIGTEFATAGGGTLTLNADGSYSYTPPAQGSVPTGGLTEEFSYTITDANGDTSSSTLTITVADNNLLPVAAPDTDTAAEGGAGVSKTAAVGLIKVNDTEGDGPAAVTSAGQGANAITIGTEFATAGGGTLTLNADGSYSYTPPAQGSVPTGGLTEEFSYTITDANGDTSSSTLTITVGKNIPTYALISSFKAYLDEQNRVVLEWKTDSEIGTIGFLLKRLNKQSGEYEAVTQELMPGMLTPPHGGEYRYVDLTAEPGKEHIYRVVEVAVNSQGAVSGPYTVRAEKPLPVNPAMQADGPEGFSLAHESVSTKQVRRAVLRQQAAKSLAAQVKKKISKTLKVPVSKDGLVYLTADRIAAASGLTKRQVQQQLTSKKCLVTLQGKRIPALFASNGGAFWFYGQAPARLDIGQNIYRLELGKQSAVMVAAPQVAGKGRAVVGQSFVHQERLEENHMPFHLYINKPVRDFWAWEYLLAHGKTAELKHSIAAPSLTGSGSAALTVNLVNISSRSTGTAAPYKVTVSLNGTELGSEETAEIGDWQLTMDVPASLLHESGNEVKVVSQLNSGTVYSLIYLESFELKHERKYEAADGELTFSSGQATKVTVEGFSTKNVLALDISNPVKPVRLRTAVSKSKTAADGFAVTVRTKPGRSYFITENLAAADAETVTADSPSQLRSGKNRADYLIIAPLHLLDSARRLAEHRQSQGLASMVVDIEDVQDEFSHGLAAPEAVHDFLAYVHGKWAQAPRYVALIGDGSYDYRNHLLYGWPVIPSVLVATPEGFFPSDNALADVAGNDGVPEFAVGRIPVFDKAEFDRYIDKVISYELSAGSGSMTVVNDKNDPAAGNFKASAELVAGFAPEQMTVSKLDVDSLGVTAVHDRIKTAMQQGTGILHYIGHSSLIGFGKGNGLLSAKNIEELNPAGQPTLMVSMSCSAASFGYPAMNSIGESAVLRADGAAVGFFGATGLSFNHLGDIIAEGFYRSLFDQAAAPRLGDAVLESKRHYRQVKQGDDAATMDIYNLLGDPAVRMPALP